MTKIHCNNTVDGAEEHSKVTREYSFKAKNRFTTFLYSKPLLILVCTITLLSFCYLDFSPLLEKIIRIMAVFLDGTVFLFYLFQKKFTKQSLLLLAIFAIELLSTIIGKDASIKNFILLYIRLLGFYSYLETGFRLFTKRTVSTLSKVLFVLVFINWLTIVIFPSGLYLSELYTTNWFFLYDNMHIIWYLAAICISYINHEINNTKRYNLAILLFLTTYSVIFCLSANSIVAYAILLFYLVFANFLNKSKILNYKSYLVTFILANISFVFLRVQEWFSWFIVELLGKSLTFTGRTVIWDKALNYIAARPILGYGLEPSSVIAYKLGNVHYTHAHNTLLDITYKGGLVSSFLFMVMLFSLRRSLEKCIDTKIRNFLSIVLFCLMLMMVFEARQEKIGFYIIIAAASCAQYFLSKTMKSPTKSETQL